MKFLALAAALMLSSAAGAQDFDAIDATLNRLASDGRFSGAVVIRDSEGVRFARGFGLADPFEGRRFTADTPVDSASLAKPVTSAAILQLAAEGKLDLEAAVRDYLPEFPHPTTTVRQLLSHSAGLDLKETATGLENKDNAALLAEATVPLFPPGTAFSYCNLCSVTLALLIERVTGQHYLQVVRSRTGLSDGVALRPARLADWKGRAIGYRRLPDGKLERYDSWEDELLYGPANFSISANQLAQWGSLWWQSKLAPIRQQATAPAEIAGKSSGLTLGNWYCAPAGTRCHYLGHHEAFHHMLYWDGDKQLSVAMVTNNALAPGLQQRLQRALVALAEGEADSADAELDKPLQGPDVPVGRFSLPSGETVEVVADGQRRSVRRGGIGYPAYPIGAGIRYVPGLDLYVTGSPGGGLKWLSLYEDLTGVPLMTRD